MKSPLSGRTALGKGLGALIKAPKYPNLNDNYFMCGIHLLEADPDQPRQSFDDTKLLELVASVKEKGVLQPLLVRRIDDNSGPLRSDRYLIIAGERRLRASKLAGLTEVPVVVKEVADDEAFEIALIENIQRDDLNPIEEAQAYRRLIDQSGSTQETVARKVGKDRSTVANALRLLRLPLDVQNHVVDGRLTSGHARTILSLEDPTRRERLVGMILDDQMSVRQAEKTAKKLKADDGPSKPKKLRTQALKPYFDSVAEELSQALDATVTVQSRGRKGRIQLNFTSIEDLRRLRDTLLEASKAS